MDSVVKLKGRLSYDLKCLLSTASMHIAWTRTIEVTRLSLCLFKLYFGRYPLEDKAPEFLYSQDPLLFPCKSTVYE